VHGLFRASGIVMIYRLNHESGRRQNGVPFRMPGSVLKSRGGSVLESAEGRGDVIVFYRTGGYYKGVATTLAIVDGVYQQIKNEEQFISVCRKRSVFTDKELSAQWNWKGSRPFIVGFLYAYALPKRPNLKELIDNGVIRSIDEVPRGFERITPEQFAKILELSKANPRFIVD
jgi:hypothetical protein